MKRFLCLITVIAALATSVQAEGYQVNTLSAKQLGMGHVGVSMKLNSESLWFNPAGAAFQDSKFHISAGVTAINANSSYKSLKTATNGYESDIIAHADNPISTPMYLYANYKVTDDLGIGLSFNTPFGSSVDWGEDWAGASLVQDISLEAFNLQPTVSYKMLDDKLSVGAGLMIAWGSFDLSRLIYKDLLSTNVHGDSKLAFGYNIGVMYDINDKWTIGASYRSKINIKVNDGIATLKYANDNAKDIVSTIPQLAPYQIIDNQDFSAQLPLPATLSFGATYSPRSDWKISMDIQWVEWSAYEMLTLDFNEPSLKVLNIESEKNYSNTIMCRFGTEYKFNDTFTGRTGIYIDQSPVDSEYFNPETPSMAKVGYTIGGSLYPCKNKDIAVDFSYCYLTSADPERTGRYQIKDTAGNVVSVFEGNYEVYAHIFSIGASFAF